MEFEEQPFSVSTVFNIGLPTSGKANVYRIDIPSLKLKWPYLYRVVAKWSNADGFDPSIFRKFKSFRLDQYVINNKQIGGNYYGKYEQLF